MALLDNLGGSQAGLLNFLQSPEALSLAQGLLQGAQPNMAAPVTFGGALSQGLGAMQKTRESEKDRAIRERLAAVQEGNLDLERMYKNAQIGKLQQDAERNAAQQQILQQYLANNQGQADLSDEEANRRRDVAILAGAGFTQEAFKKMTEKREKDITKTPTQSFVTTNQEVIQAANNVIPVLDEIIESPSIPGALTGYFSPDEKAKYDADVITIAEGLLKARGLSNTEGTLKKIIETVKIKPLESESSYKARIKGVKKEIIDRRKRAEKITPIGRESNMQKDNDSGMITIVNRKTGEEKQVTRQEALDMGIDL